MLTGPGRERDTDSTAGRAPDHSLSLEFAPRVLFRLIMPDQAKHPASDEQIYLPQNELTGLYPAWPVPYVLLQTFNSARSSSLGLFDLFGNTIQLNLYFLEGKLKDTALLGGSTRIDPKFEGYGTRPSELSAMWLRDQVCDWLAARGLNKLFVRAFFESEDGGNKAPLYFGKIGFKDAPEIGTPFMSRDLVTPQTFALCPSRSLVPEFILNISSEEAEEFMRTHEAMREMSMSYIKKVGEASTNEQKVSAYDSVRNRNRGVSERHFDFYFGVARDFQSILIAAQR